MLNDTYTTQSPIDTNEPPSAPIMITTLPQSDEVMDPTPAPRQRKSRVVKAAAQENGSIEKPVTENVIYFLVGANGSQPCGLPIEIEVDPERAAARAILDKSLTLYRGIPVKPVDVLRQ